MPEVAVRQATVADSDAIGLVHTRTWQVAYADLLPAELLAGIDPARRAAGWHRTLTDPRPGHSTLVAECDGTVVGFADSGRSRDDGAADDEGEVRAIYVDPDRWDSGAGRALMVASLDALRTAGFTSAVLWVLVDNERARSFYERGGWSADGSTKDEDNFGVVVTEVRYRIRLA